MTPKYQVRTKQTIDTINDLMDSGVNKISVLIRHSERFFSEDAGLEPFMGLTDKGKEFAFDFGAGMRPNTMPKLYSSFLGRCIETAFLIDKGFTKQNNQNLDHNCMDPMLSPFYVSDIDKAIPLIKKLGNNSFLREWFDNRIDENIMENPRKTSDILSEFMVEKIKKLKHNQIAICASHDWNIYPLKEFKLDLKHESAGDVGYLDGLVFFEKENQYYIKNYQTRPVLL
ncbi:MAG: histidine phosphatase family protein [Desulfobacula sp.]|jgi:broad specificity phosphatase PhoE|uniref:histidine phosphatase family protein n=1 Tax=Desulfobacula sp. TaxID=2593537 RepID=UPI001DE3B339|nr:histidine phosphatase family protein [Desulfobacula sp.]MBT3484381.1 histidine phosphatase family protein [Desulfobacula sp.]MBT3803296.1 histidine phosphatase family protein [Desulfobacula sp.]MBT4023738.1 histidine phosphatase family protein [Desulfobacula sp.]MBT4197980.1 histidine phosphatase family protein [Desulfobacula sp.]